MYLGEITRNLLVSLIDAAPRGLLFNGKGTSVVNSQWGLDTSVMSDIEVAWEGGSPNTKSGPTDEPNSDVVFSRLGEFDENTLTAGVRKRLERVKNVIVKSLRYSEAEVSLKDAAVSF
jgi:hexokinase